MSVSKVPMVDSSLAKSLGLREITRANAVNMIIANHGRMLRAGFIMARSTTEDHHYIWPLAYGLREEFKGL